MKNLDYQLPDEWICSGKNPKCSDMIVLNETIQKQRSMDNRHQNDEHDTRR